MPIATTSASARAPATALATPDARGMLAGGFATFAPNLRMLDERIRQGVRSRDATRTVVRTLEAALRRRQAAEPGRVQFVTDVRLMHRQVALLVSYHHRWGAIDVVASSPSPRDSQGDLRSAGIALADHVRPDEVTDSHVADKLVDRFLVDLAATPGQRAGFPERLHGRF